jgi:predicted  nucleic acid-binding Zn-ribbon protein
LIAAKLEEKTNSKKMNKLEEILSKIENSISKLVKNEGPEIKNGSFYLIDGETEIYFEGEEIIPGQTMVFLDEQLTTAAPDGEHTLQDGRILIVSAGMAVEILAPQAKIDQLKTDLQNANERIASLENEFSKKLEEVQNKLTDVLNKVPGSGKIENQFENKNLTAAQKHRANRRTI